MQISGSFFSTPASVIDAEILTNLLYYVYTVRVKEEAKK